MDNTKYVQLIGRCELRKVLFCDSKDMDGAQHEGECESAIADLLARAEEAEQKVNELERALSDASKIVNTMQESTIPFYRRRAEEAEADNARLRELVEADRDGRCVVVTRCCECENHVEFDGQHYCKFWRMYCPDDSEFYCKAAKDTLKGQKNG